MFGSSAAIVAGRLVASAAALALVAWLSRAFPRDQLGVYAVVMTTANIGSVFAQLGQRYFLSRQLPLVADAAPVVRRSLLAVGVAAVGLGLLWIAAAGPFDGFVRTAIGALILALLAVHQTLVGALTGTGRVLWGGLAQQGLMHVIALGVIVALASVAAFDATAVLAGQAIAAAITVAVTAAGLGLVPREPPSEVSERPSGSWLTASGPLTVLGGLGVLSSQIDVLIVRGLDSSDGAGLYYNAAALALVPAYALQAANMVIMPGVSRAWAEQRPEQMHRLLGQSLRFALVGAVPATIAVLTVYPLGAAHGLTFVEGIPILAVLLGGQLVNVSCGSVGVTLLMCGYERLVATSYAGSLTLNVALSVALVPMIGPLGAAIGTAAALTAWNLWLVVNLRARIGVDTSIARAFGRPHRPA